MVATDNHRDEVEMSVHLPTEPNRKSERVFTCCGCATLIVLAVVLYAIYWYVQRGMNS